MKRIFILAILVMISMAAFSQPPQVQQRPGVRAARVQGLKIEFVTRYLKLTTDEATFWPLYYEYSDALKKTRDEQPEDVITTDEKILMIKKKYRTEFKKVLGTDERAMKVFTIDREFNSILKAELEKRVQQRKDNR